MLKLSKRKNRKRGLTLVEAIVSVLILGITVGAMLGVFMIGRYSVTKGKDYIEAMNLARARMEWIKAQNYADLNRGTASVTAAYPYLASTESVTIDVGRDIDNDGIFDNDGDELIGTRITQVEPIGSPEEYLKVTVTVSWTERLLGGSGWQASKSLITFISE